jgi:hypothetical protein
MENLTRFALAAAAAAGLVLVPALAESKASEEKGVQEAIAFQRAKDRADAAQARKEARHPEQFTQAAPKQNPPNGLATEQRREALQKSEPKKAQKESAPAH